MINIYEKIVKSYPLVRTGGPVVSLLVAVEFRKFWIFEALQSHGASKQVNNITLHRDNHSKLCLGEFKNKKGNDIIKVSVGPKFGFVINISKKNLETPFSNTTTGLPWVLLQVVGNFRFFRIFEALWSYGASR